MFLGDLDEVFNPDNGCVVVDVDDGDLDNGGIHVAIDVGRGYVKLKKWSDLWKELRNEYSCKRIREIASSD